MWGHAQLLTVACHSISSDFLVVVVVVVAGSLVALGDGGFHTGRCFVGFRYANTPQGDFAIVGVVPVDAGEGFGAAILSVGLIRARDGNGKGAEVLLGAFLVNRCDFGIMGAISLKLGENLFERPAGCGVLRRCCLR